MSIQLSHQMATKEGTVLRYRTGYESLIAHRAGKLYAYPAKQDGVVLEVNESAKMVKIQYKDGSIHSFTYGEEYGYCSDLVTTQKQELTIKQGDKFKKDEILCYNPQFFEKDPYKNQVYWKHGALATIAIIEVAGDYEDSSTITSSFGEKLMIEPVQVRIINLDKNTYVHQFKHIGDIVDINDNLLVFEDADTTDLTGVAKDNETLEYLAKLNRKTPRAKYAGTIVGIEMYIGCELSEIHDTLKEIYKEANKLKRARHKFSADTKEAVLNPALKVIPKGTKFKGVMFDENTVVIRYLIQEKLNCGLGDKMVVDSALKSVVSDVLTHPVKTESGVDIDVLFSATSASNRIIFSVFLQGMCERILEKLEDDVVDIWTN